MEKWGDGQLCVIYVPKECVPNPFCLFTMAFFSKKKKKKYKSIL